MSEEMGLIALLDQAERVYAGKMRELSQAAHDCDQARRELAALTDELAKLQAEREPRDNGDGTVTRLLPVTFPNGLDVDQVREPKVGDEFVSDLGERLTATLGLQNKGRIRLILRPAPQTPEPVTWEAPFVDGEVLAHERCVEVDGWGNTWEAARKMFGVTHPSKLGTYQFKDGVGTLIQEAS